MPADSAPDSRLVPIRRKLEPAGAPLSGFLERSVDGEQEFSLREFLTRLVLRKWILLLCVVIPTVVGVAATAITPITWYATTEILIRYGASESPFLKDLIPDDRAPISGGTSGEIIRSLPTLEEAVRQYDIQEADLYRSERRVVSGYLWSLVRPFFGSDDEPSSANEKVQEIAKTLQDSLLESSKAGGAASSRTAPIAVLGKDSPVPQAMKGDELITLTVKGFNRTKIAEITNGLAQTFIDQYYKISAGDARRSYEFLSQMVDKFAVDVQRLEKDPDAATSSSLSDLRLGSGDVASIRNSPAMTDLANALATLKAELGHLQQIYREDSPRVQRVQSEIESIKKAQAGQQRLDMAKQVLEQIKARRFQALNAESLYKDHLMPISIIEPAVTPAPSSSAQLIRLLLSGIIGMLIGAPLGLALVVVISLMDQRLYTTWDVERALRLPIFGWLPRLASAARRDNGPLAGDTRDLHEAENGLLQVLARLDKASVKGDANVVAVASSNDDEGKSFISLLLARSLARSGNAQVLLVDADPGRASLTSYFGKSGTPGLVDAVVNGDLLANVIVHTGVPHVDLMPAGSESERHRIGFYLRGLRQWLDEARGMYDLIVIDTPSAATGGGALICCMAADRVLLVVKCGSSRKGPIKSFLRKLQEVAATPEGVILNFRRNILPGFIYRRT